VCLLCYLPRRCQWILIRFSKKRSKSAQLSAPAGLERRLQHEGQHCRGGRPLLFVRSEGPWPFRPSGLERPPGLPLRLEICLFLGNYLAPGVPNPSKFESLGKFISLSESNYKILKFCLGNSDNFSSKASRKTMKLSQKYQKCQKSQNIGWKFAIFFRLQRCKSLESQLEKNTTKKDPENPRENKGHTSSKRGILG